MLPALPLLAGGLSALYSAGKAYDNYRYWNDYYLSTGYRPRYGFRAGRYDWMSNNIATIYAINKVFK